MRKSVAGSIADPTIKTAKLKLGGQEYALCYSFNAIAEAEQVAGCNLLLALRNLDSLFAIQFRGLFYAALTKMQPDMTIERAGSMITVKNLDAIRDAIAEAYTLSVEDPENPPLAAA